jgi:hypothetical protein
MDKKRALSLPGAAEVDKRRDHRGVRRNQSRRRGGNVVEGEPEMARSLRVRGLLLLMPR